MDQVLKIGVSVFLIFLFLLLGIGILTASTNASAAEQFTEDCATQIENFNFSQDVIDKCVVKAHDRGYELTYNKIDGDGDGRTDMVELITKYDFSIFLKNDKDTSDKKHTVRVYAR